MIYLNIILLSNKITLMLKPIEQVEDTISIDISNENENHEFIVVEKQTNDGYKIKEEENISSTMSTYHCFLVLFITTIFFFILGIIFGIGTWSALELFVQLLKHLISPAYIINQ